MINNDYFNIARKFKALTIDRQEIVDNKIYFTIDVVGPHKDEKITYYFTSSDVNYDITTIEGQWKFAELIYWRIEEQSKHSNWLGWLWVKSVRKRFPGFTPGLPERLWNKVNNDFLPGNTLWKQYENWKEVRSWEMNRNEHWANQRKTLKNSLEFFQTAEMKEVETRLIDRYSSTDPLAKREKVLTKEKLKAALKIASSNWLSIMCALSTIAVSLIWFICWDNLVPWVWGVSGFCWIFMIAGYFQYMIIYIILIPEWFRSRNYVKSLVLNRKLELYQFYFKKALSVSEYIENAEKIDKILQRAYTTIQVSKVLIGMCNALQSETYSEMYIRSTWGLFLIGWGS